MAGKSARWNTAGVSASISQRGPIPAKLELTVPAALNSPSMFLRDRSRSSTKPTSVSRGGSQDKRKRGHGLILAAPLLRPQVVLVHMADPAAGQCRGPGGDRGEADVERVRGQRCRDRDVQVIQPGLSAGCGGERLEEIRLPGHYLQDQLAHVYLRHHRLAAFAEVGQTGRVRDRRILLRVQAPLVANALEPKVQDMPTDGILGTPKYRAPATVLDRHLRRRRCRSVEDVPVRGTRAGTAHLLRGPGLLQLRHPHAIVSSSEASSELGPLLLQLGELPPEPSQLAVDVRQLRRCPPVLEAPLAMANPHDLFDLAAKQP